MYNYQKIDNGLEVIATPMKSTKTATVLVLIATGSKYETEKIKGISHFLEHLIFKGTKKRPTPLDITKELDQVGGEYNAFTGKEYTGFYIKLASKHLNLALDVLSDILTNSLFPEEQIEKEKKVISQEIDLYEDTPTKLIGDIFEELLYKGQPAGRRIIGNREAIESFTRKDIVSYFNSHYVSQNSLVSVAGNIRPQNMFDKINTYFSSFKPGPSSSKVKTKEKQKNPRLKLYKKDTDQTHLIVGTRAFDMCHPQTPALKILATILGGNMSSRLFTRIREKMAASYYIQSKTQLYQDTGYLYTQAGCSHKKAAAVVKAICKEYEKIKKSPPSDEELTKAKEYIKGKTLIDLEASDSQAGFYGSQKLLKDQIEDTKEKFEKIDRVSAQDITETAQQTFCNSKLNLALIGPDKNKDKLHSVLSL